MNISFIHLAIIGLAAARLSRLIVTDKIGQRFRAMLKLWFPPGLPYTGMHRAGFRKWSYDRTRPARQTRRFVPALLACNWCMSVWTTAAVYVVWTFGPVWLQHCVFAVAASMIAGLANDYFEDAEEPEQDTAPQPRILSVTPPGSAEHPSATGGGCQSC